MTRPPETRDKLLDVAALERAYEQPPNLDDPAQLVSFGTSGHRGSSLRGTFNEAHVLAITQAICDYRRSRKISGPLFMGKDTHALSGPAQRTALEVLAGNGVETFIQLDDGFTPTPVISRAILVYNKNKNAGLADGIVITPSHNPPEDGGLKYNPPQGGAAGAKTTRWIQRRANDLLRGGNKDPRRIVGLKAPKAETTHEVNFITSYVADLRNVLDMEAVAAAKLRIGVDPLGGSSLSYWDPINALYNIEVTVVNRTLDPTFSFMTLDHDGKIRMDCSSRWAMASLIRLKDKYDLAFGNDPDADRHGIVTPSVGLMNPNHYLAVAVGYLLTNRPDWPKNAAIGKTLVSSSMIDRVVKKLNRSLCEMPVGFKWFAPGLFDASLCFGGEESAGASFLRRDGTVWTTDKDGLIMNLLAAEITARTGKDPGELYEELTVALGTPYYTRVDAPATREEKTRLEKLSPEAIITDTLAGDPITAKLSTAPGNDAPIGGIKVMTENGWFAARPSGTENICKIYAESFRNEKHLKAIVQEAQEIVATAVKSPGPMLQEVG